MAISFRRDFPQASPEKVNKLTAIDAFEQYAEDYDRWFDTPEGKALFEMEIETVRFLSGGLKQPFLEIGVGSGRFARALGIEFGIDPSPKLLKMARKRGIKAEKAFGENIPFRNRMFGGVFVLFTLCFAVRPEAIVSEAARVLKTGGGLILGIINKASPWGQLYAQKKTEGHPIYKYATFYSIEEAEKMIVMAGLQLASYSSTLYQSPTGAHCREAASYEKGQDAGFVCILAKKS